MESEIVEHTDTDTVRTKEIIEANSVNETHRTGEHEECKSNLGSPVGALGGEEEEKGGQDFAIDVNHGEEDILREEIICRICHLSCSHEPSSMAAAGGGGSELIELGCHCKGELGMSHRYCAETWFNQRGNRVCEICGVVANNVKISKKATRIWIVDFDDMRSIGASSYANASSSSASPVNSSTRMCRQTCCNLLLACVLLGLVIPWFFRVKLF